MEIRKKADTRRTLDVRKITIRTAGRSPNARRTYGTKRNSVYGNRIAAGSVLQRNKRPSATVIREKELVKALTPEQRKQWNTYSACKKEQILEQTGRRVKSRIRYESRQEQKQEEKVSVLVSDVYFPERKERMKRNRMDQKRYQTVVGRKVPEKKIHHAVPHTVIPRVREVQLQGEKRSVVHRNAAIGKNIPQSAHFPKVKTVTKETTRVPVEKAQARRKRRLPAKRKNVARNAMISKINRQTDLPYSQSDAKGWKRQAQEEKGQKQQNKKIEKLYVRTFVTLVEKDRKKTEQVRQQQKSGQITMTVEQLTAAQRGQLVNTAALPIRFKAAVIKGRIIEKAAKIAGAFAVQAAKYAAMLGLPILILYLLLQIIAGVLGGLAGDSDTIGSGLYSASGAAIVAYAEEWIGVTRYQMGAGRVSEMDWQDVADCSSFVYGVYHHFSIPIGGVAWGGTTYTMEGQGTLVAKNSLDDAVVSDIILFFTPSFGSGNSVHVGIYAGNGMMIHNSSTAGHVLKTSYMSYANYEVRRFVTDVEGGGSGTASGGHRADPAYRSYSQSQLETIWAVVAQEDNGSYEGALAVASCIMNRTESPAWQYLGSSGWQQMTANGQFCYSNDSYWTARLGGNVPSYVKQAVNDCFGNGVRNHSYTSFRSTNGSASNYTAVQIGGNWYFGN